MTLRLVQVNFKAADDQVVGRFWADALDWELSSEGPGVTNAEPRNYSYPDPVALCIDVVRVPDPETVRYRAHLDLASESLEHQAAIVARLKALGATSVDIGQGDVPWEVMADPEGNVFCVLEPRDAYRDTGPIAAVVVNCIDPREMAEFWGRATDWTTHRATDEFASLRSSAGVGPYLEFIRNAEPDSVPTRMHLDLRPYSGDVQADDVARLKSLGARNADVGQGDVPWTVLADIEGNEFCVLSPG